jgi:hypothetical protein
MDAPAVTHGAAAERQRLGQRRAGRSGEELVVERERRVDRRQVRAEVGDGAESRDAGLGRHGGSLEA